MAVREAAPKGRPALLEPMMKVEVTCPDEYLGDVLSDFTRRRGRIEGMDQIAGLREVRAVAPLAEMFGYAGDLRGRTQGRASHVMEFSHYEEVPPHVANEIMQHTGSNYRFS